MGSDTEPTLMVSRASLRPGEEPPQAQAEAHGQQDPRRQEAVEQGETSQHRLLLGGGGLGHLPRPSMMRRTSSRSGTRPERNTVSSMTRAGVRITP